MDAAGAAGSHSSTPSPSSSMVTSDPAASVSTSSTPTSTSAAVGGSTGATTTRSKRQELSFAERIQVILARKGGKSMRQLALQFGCGKTQILNILGQRESYLREWEEKEGPSNPHIGARKRRSRRTGNEETNRLVWDWYQQQRNSGLRVTGPMLQREARSIARSLGIANFAASNGWLDSFRRLHNIGPQSKNQEQRVPSNQETTEPAVAISSSAGDPLVIDLHPATDPLAPASSAYESEFIPIQGAQHYAPVTSTHSSVQLYEPLAGFSLSASYDQLVDYDPHATYAGLSNTRDSNDFDPLVDVVGSVTSTSSTDPSVVTATPSLTPTGGHQAETQGEFKHFANMAAVFHDSPEFDPSLMHHSSLVYPTAVQLAPFGDAGVVTYSGGGLQNQSVGGSSSFLASLDDVFQMPTYTATIGRPQLEEENCPSGSGHCPPPPPPMPTGPQENVDPPANTSAFKSVIQPHPGLEALLPLEHLSDARDPPVYSAPVRRSVLVSTRSAAANASEEKRRRLAAAEVPSADPEETFSRPAEPSQTPVTHCAASVEGSLAPRFIALVSMARSRDLQPVTYNDEEGNQWLEIRPGTAGTRVPLYGYRTHLVRLLVDQQLNYWVESVGRCVRSGSFRQSGSADHQILIDSTVTGSVLDAVAGGFQVCHGRGSIFKRVGQFRPKLVIQHGAAERMTFSLPDYRFRSFDCAYWIDSRTGPRCPACQSSYRRPDKGAHVPHVPAPATDASSPRSSPGEPLNLSVHMPQALAVPPMPGLQPITVLHLAGQNLLESPEEFSGSSFGAVDQRLALEAARCISLHGRDRPSSSQSVGFTGPGPGPDDEAIEAEFEAYSVKQEPMESSTDSSSRDSQRLQ